MESQASEEGIERAQRALGLALRELRKRAALSQKELSARTGAHPTYISQVESGLRDIRWSTITRLLAGLDATVEDFAGAVARHLT